MLARLHAIDPHPVIQRLAASDAARPDIDGMLRHLRATAEQLERPALATCVAWLDDHRPPTDSDVVCHGDMHPFNVLATESRDVTVLDWSAGVIAPRSYDLGFTSLMLAEPPLVVPRFLRPLIRRAGRALSHRFVRQYESTAGVQIDREVLGWYQGLICVRALGEVASWAVAGSLAGREGHPWVINQHTLVRRLHALTGVRVPIQVP